MSTFSRPLAAAAAACLLALSVSGPVRGEPPPVAGEKRLEARITAALPRQQALVEAATRRLAPQRPGERDIYFIGVAGYGDQNVFRLEVERVRKLFDERFGTRGRSVVLINNPGTLRRVPLATADNLAATLEAVGGLMDRDEDLLVLFMTSHGIEDDGFVVRLNGRSFGHITPDILAEALAHAGIRQRVLIVSACFSGQFVPALSDEDSLVITAAAADRSSFGCSTRAQWTWFGESYFKRALPRTGRFVEAFERARRLVGAREDREGFPASRPQIALGAHLAKVLGEMGL